MNVIECRGVSKVFAGRERRTEALNEVSFALPEGIIAGVLGPDAAGKTTLLRILTGLLQPTSGTAQVLGCDTVRDAGRIQKIGRAHV